MFVTLVLVLFSVHFAPSLPAWKEEEEEEEEINLPSKSDPDADFLSLRIHSFHHYHGQQLPSFTAAVFNLNHTSIEAYNGTRNGSTINVVIIIIIIDSVQIKLAQHTQLPYGSHEHKLTDYEHKLLTDTDGLTD